MRLQYLLCFLIFICQLVVDKCNCKSIEMLQSMNVLAGRAWEELLLRRVCKDGRLQVAVNINRHLQDTRTKIEKQKSSDLQVYHGGFCKLLIQCEWVIASAYGGCLQDRNLWGKGRQYKDKLELVQSKPQDQMELAAYSRCLLLKTSNLWVGGDKVWGTELSSDSGSENLKGEIRGTWRIYSPAVAHQWVKPGDQQNMGLLLAVHRSASYVSAQKDPTFNSTSQPRAMHLWIN